MSTSALSDDHKRKLADGRRETRAVEAYLLALENKQTQTQSRDLAEVKADIEQVDHDLSGGAAGLDRLKLLQRREDLLIEASVVKPAQDITQLEKSFVAVAASYGERKNISYTTWREFGVPKPVLEAAGVKRTRRPSVELN